MELETLVQKVAQRDFPLEWPGHRISDTWVAPGFGSEAKQSLNPSTGELLIRVRADRDSVRQAVDEAWASAHSDASRRSVATASLEERCELLARFAQMLADYRETAIDLLRLEDGRPRWDAELELEAALAHLQRSVQLHGEVRRYSLASTDPLGETSQALLPLGPTLAYLPFGTSLSSFAIYYAAAMLSGCPLVVVASAHASCTAMFLALVHSRIDPPEGSLSLLFGNFNSFKLAAADKRVEAVIYTGSLEHCRTLRKESQAFSGRQYVLQSGGKNALVVHSTADIETAVTCTLLGMCRAAGQLCSSTSRVFVYRSRSEEYLEALMAALEKLTIGPTDGEDGEKDPVLGPLYSKKAVEKFLRFQTMASREAEKTLAWGKALGDPGKGFSVTPGVHLMRGFDAQSAYQSNVMFAPDIAIYPYDVLDEALAHASSSEALLSCAFVGDPQIALARREQFRAPNVAINRPTVELADTFVVSGRRHCGQHRVGGLGLIRALTYPQAVRLGDGSLPTPFTL